MPAPTQSTVTISLAYHDAPRAIEWICRVFGFQRHAVYPGPGNTILHSELTLDGGMVMVSSMPEGEYRPFMKHPGECGGAETMAISLIVPDADAVYARVKGAGGTIALDIEDKHYGGRGFACRDVEGHIWNVGTYDPWKPK